MTFVAKIAPFLIYANRSIVNDALTAVAGAPESPFAKVTSPPRFTRVMIAGTVRVIITLPYTCVSPLRETKVLEGEAMPLIAIPHALAVSVAKET